MASCGAPAVRHTSRPTAGRAGRFVPRLAPMDSRSRTACVPNICRSPTAALPTPFRRRSPSSSRPARKPSCWCRRASRRSCWSPMGGRRSSRATGSGCASIRRWCTYSTRRPASGSPRELWARGRKPPPLTRFPQPIGQPTSMAKKSRKPAAPLRSTAWFGRHDRDALVHRSWMKNQGIPHDQFDGRPVIGICNTWSQATPCNAHFRDLAEHVRRGVLDAGGFPIEFPVMSLGETLMRPTTMLFRNQCAMDVEESIRANPFDGVVLLMGCDKTTPALLMGAASCDLPTIGLSGGPMLNGKFRGEDIGSGTHVWKFTEMLKTGEMSEADMIEAESCLSRSAGHCMTMGTASTMASMVEALGIGLPSNAAIPAVDARRYVLAHMAGRRIVEMVREDLRMSKILTREAFENAIRVNAAIGGSTNAIVHLLAIAGRLGVPLTLEDFDKLGHDMPLLTDLMPHGRLLMEDFYYAGGLPAVIRELGDLLHRDALTVTGKSLGENNKDAPCWNADVIRPLDKPLKERAGIAVLRGNLCPDGAVIKPSAATPNLLK